MNRNRLLYDIATVYGATGIKPNSAQNFLLSKISIALGGVGGVSNNRNYLLDEILTRLGGTPSKPSSRNDILVAINTAITPVYTSIDYNRNKLLTDWLGMI